MRVGREGEGMVDEEGLDVTNGGEGANGRRSKRKKTHNMPSPTAAS